MRILLVQTSFLGDTVLSTPVIAGIHALFPGCELWTLTTAQSAELIRRDPLVHGTLILEKRGVCFGSAALFSMALKLRRLRFDRAIVLHRSWRTALLMLLSGIPFRVGFKESAMPWVFHQSVARSGFAHDVLRNLAILTPFAALDRFDAALRLTPMQLGDLSSAVREALPPPRSYVVLVPGSVWATKRWHWQNYRDLAQQLLSEGSAVVVLGAPNEREVCDRVSQDLPVINLCGCTSIGEFVYSIANASSLVCNDSVALHVASTFKIPTAAVFCATSPTFGFGPWQNPRAKVVERADLSCKPCSRHGGKVCPAATEACMRDLPVSAVRNALRECERADLA